MLAMLGECSVKLKRTMLFRVYRGALVRELVSAEEKGIVWSDTWVVGSFREALSVKPHSVPMLVAVGFSRNALMIGYQRRRRDALLERESRKSSDVPACLAVA
ncbi:hypothetical protein KM043_015375 [Ampulex compressa]|nr:hypothetical protein KM043_015375 [Ampulex compressa]